MFFNSELFQAIRRAVAEVDLTMLMAIGAVESITPRVRKVLGLDHKPRRKGRR
jgi:hypothetical protein